MSAIERFYELHARLSSAANQAQLAKDAVLDEMAYRDRIIEEQRLEIETLRTRLELAKRDHGCQ